MRPDKRRSELKHSLLVALFFACGLTWGCASGGSDPPLRVEVAGCALLRSGPVCEFDPAQPLNLWIETAGGAELRISAGGVAEQLQAPSPLGELKAHLTPPPSAFLLTVQATLSGHRTTFNYALAPHQEPQWLTAAESLKKAGQYDAAKQAVENVLTPESPPELQAQAYGMLARIAMNRNLLGESRILFNKALALDRTSGLISAEANHTFGLVFAMMRDGASLAEIQHVIADKESSAGLYPEWRARMPYYLGQAAYVNFAPQQAYPLLSEARRWAYRLDLDEITAAVPMVLSQTMQELGDPHAAAKLVREQLAQQAIPRGAAVRCEQAFLMDSLAWSYLQALEARRTDPLAANEALEYPAFSQLGVSTLQELLQAVLKAYPGCGQDQSELARIYLNLARAELATGTPKNGHAWIAEAVKLVPKPTSGQRVEQLELAGQLALALHDPQAALAAYREMAALAAVVQLPQETWQALVGEAEAHEQLQDHAAALDTYRRAEELLNTPQLGIVLCQDNLDHIRANTVESRFLSSCISGHLALLPFQRGTRRYLDLLLRMGQKEQALETMRLSRTRTLAAWQLAQRIRKLDGPGRVQWQDVRDRYTESRRQVAQLAEKSWIYSAENRPLVDAHLHAAEQRAAADFKAVLDALPAAPETNPKLAPPPATAALLVCHPLTEQWACLVKFNGRIEAEYVPADLFREVRRCAPPLCPSGLPPGQCPQRPCKPDLPRLARDLFQEPVRALIAEAPQLWIIPLGELRLVDFAALPFPDASGPALLSDRKPTLYSEDLPAVDATPGTPDEPALVVLDAHGELANSRLSATGLAAHAELARRGPALILAGAPSAGSTPGASAPVGEAATGQNFLRHIQQSRFLLYIGHNQVSPGVFGWDTQLLTFDTSVHISDLLTIARGPRAAILIGCETGGAAAAQYSEQLSMAQVLLLRGARQVLSAVRIITPAHADIMLRALIEHGALAAQADLAAVLQAAQRDVRAQKTELDWSAYRVSRQ